MSLNETQEAFIGSLLHLAGPERPDRGALADLRSGLGKEPGEMNRVHKYVVPYLPDNDYDDQWYYILASLFGLYPVYRQGTTLSAAFRKLRPKSESIETRFIAVLNAHSEDLDEHLRHAISILKSNDCPFNWFRLFDDLLQWEHHEKYIQLRWARDFYKTDLEGTQPNVRNKE